MRVVRIAKSGQPASLPEVRTRVPLAPPRELPAGNLDRELNSCLAVEG